MALPFAKRRDRNLSICSVRSSEIECSPGLRTFLPHRRSWEAQVASKQQRTPNRASSSQPIASTATPPHECPTSLSMPCVTGQYSESPTAILGSLREFCLADLRSFGASL